MDKDINRLKVLLAEKKRTNKWLVGRLGKDPATVCKWCTNTMQPNVAFNTSQLLNNKGSNRAVVDSIIANTAEFYWFAKDGAKFTVWIPTERHPVGELAEWTDINSIKMAEKVLP